MNGNILNGKLENKEYRYRWEFLPNKLKCIQTEMKNYTIYRKGIRQNKFKRYIIYEYYIYQCK